MRNASEHKVDVWLFKTASNQRKIRRDLRCMLLAEYTDIAPSAICFTNEPYGKPMINSSPPLTINFNESHSTENYALAVCRTAPVGIDIEYTGTLSNAAEYALHACRESELPDFKNSAPEKYSAALLRQWVRKEAILKAWGVGLTYNPLQIDLSQFSADIICKNALVAIAGISILFTDLELAGDIIGTVAIQNNSATASLAVEIRESTS